MITEIPLYDFLIVDTSSLWFASRLLLYYRGHGVVVLLYPILVLPVMIRLLSNDLSLSHCSSRPILTRSASHRKVCRLPTASREKKKKIKKKERKQGGQGSPPGKRVISHVMFQRQSTLPAISRRSLGLWLRNPTAVPSHRCL